ncbi:MAG: Brp/Blh family beta-carotene 15,15'-dioxygenase [Flavobacterium sp.]
MLINYRYKIFLSLIALWLGNQLGGQVQAIIGIFLVLTIGVMHGTNDLLIIEKSYVGSQKSNRIKFFYLMLVNINILLFYFFPLFALCLFIFLSCYHFGEQHLEKYFVEHGNLVVNNTYYITYGMLILSGIFYLNKTEVSEIIYQITSHKIPFNWMDLFFYLSTFLYATFTIYLAWTMKTYLNELPIELMTLLTLTIIFLNASLIWSFTVFFIFWHSIPSIEDQIQHLFSEVSFKTLIQYFKKGFAIWLISLIGLILVLWLIKDSLYFYTILFSFLAAITLPHVLVMIKMFKNKEQ